MADANASRRLTIILSAGLAVVVVLGIGVALLIGSRTTRTPGPEPTVPSSVTGLETTEEPPAVDEPAPEQTDGDVEPASETPTTGEPSTDTGTEATEATEDTDAGDTPSTPETVESVPSDSDPVEPATTAGTG